MAIHSAGILLYRFLDGRLQVMLVHPGGPYWARRDAGAWTIPKGVNEAGEDLLDTAMRELREETGIETAGPFIDLGEIRQPSGKIVHVWAVAQDVDVTQLVSNTFSLEWPRNSGIIRDYPEVDRGQWFGTGLARQKILPGQAGFLERLVRALSSV
jgi:predicted NUDIX family NTP pyrophosphohydrolase